MERAVPCEVYSRVVGYFRPVHNWNIGKKQEFNERLEFSEMQSMTNPKAKAQIVPLVNGGSETIDYYKIFTFPNCDKCETVKSYLKEKDYKGEVIDLKSPEGNKVFRGYYKDLKDNIKRTEDGTLKLPIVLFMSNGNVVSTAQGVDETKTIIA